MAKSQETYNKKEKEKKRIQKRKEKDEKRQERKANNNKGKSFDDMIGYVDEYGRLTDTPPDPNATKRVEIKLEDIQLGAAKREELDPADLIHSGTVTFFNDEKGYGFIKDMKTQESFFVHYKALENPVKIGDRVSFEVEMGQKGPVAAKVTIVTA